jgi:hypothetical protein
MPNTNNLRSYMSSWDEIKQSVENNGDLLTFTMETLREAHGVGRLGIKVCPEISKVLAGMGLGHIPQELPPSQNEQVRLYKRGTPVGELIDTVLAPGESNDKKLVDQIGDSATDYAIVIEKIRELVAE